MLLEHSLLGKPSGIYAGETRLVERVRYCKYGESEDVLCKIGVMRLSVEHLYWAIKRRRVLADLRRGATHEVSH